MEKKGTIISLILVFVIAGSAIAFIVFSGITANELNYIQLEINPRIEFLCDKKNKVVSYKPLNSDARILLTGVEYIGMDIEQATTDFIDICARAGYIDVNGNDNAINITVIDGITQALDVHVTQSIYKYLKENEIMCAVVENSEDLNMYNTKKENDVCCANKYKLMSTIQEFVPEKTIQELNKLSEVELIDIVYKLHKEYENTPTENDIELKTKLIDFNRVKYETHKKAITTDTQREFSKLYEEYQKYSTPRYMINFEKSYKEWQNNHVA